MCTMTAIRTREAVLRIGFNRDELNTRPAGLPPRIERSGDVRAILPRDPQAGGTWIAATDAGLVLAILNVTRAFGPRSDAQPALAKSPGQVSRGTIIPSLLEATSANEAINAARSVPLHPFAGFRLIAIDRDEIAELLYDGTARSRVAIQNPLLFTSSGLGDHLVQHPRRRLFEAMLACNPTRAAQDAFHRHRWPDQPHLSIDMLRPDARTVSTTTVELGTDHVRMSYANGSAASIRIELPICQAVAA